MAELERGAPLGFVVGPPAVGGIAGLTDLSTSLTVVAGLAAILAVTVAVVPLPARRVTTVSGAR